MKYWDDEKELKSTADALLKSANEVKVVDPNSPLLKSANEFLNSGNVVDSRIAFSENYNKNRAKMKADAEGVKNYKPTFAGNNYVVTPEDKGKIDSLYTPPPEPRKQTARERYETRQFEYNLEDDPLWQQYLASARRNGQNAMTDTMAKVAAQTGGIAGSYAVAAGAGAYNDYIQRANDIIPELEQLAYRKYQDELNRDLTLYDMEEKEKMEKANEDAIAYKWQSKGDITDDEEVFMRSMGYWFDENGSLVGPDGNKYTTEGGKINDLEAEYKSGAKLSPEDILALENSGQGYKYQNGVLYKNGVRIPKEFMGYDEVQNAWNDFNSNTWYGMSEASKSILQQNGYVFDAATGNVKDANGNLYAPETGSATDNILWKYMSGNQLAPEEMLFISKQPGYTWDDSGNLLFNGEKVNVMTSTDKVKELDGGEIPSDLVAAWDEIVDKRGTNKGLSANVYETLGTYGFVPSSNGQWIHLATGQTLESFFGETPSVYTNPGDGTQGGATPYRKTPSEDETQVVDEPVTPAPTPNTDYSSSGKTAGETAINVLVEDRNAYNSVLGTAETLLMLGNVNEARQVLTEGVDSGKITIAQLNEFFDAYDDWF